MESGSIIFLLALGLYIITLLYLNAKVKLGGRNLPAGSEEPVSRGDEFLKAVITVVGLLIVAALLSGLLMLVYRLAFDRKNFFAR
jgi:hypothetical protein